MRKPDQFRGEQGGPELVWTISAGTLAVGPHPFVRLNAGGTIYSQAAFLGHEVIEGGAFATAACQDRLYVTEHRLPHAVMFHPTAGQIGFA